MDTKITEVITDWENLRQAAIPHEVRIQSDNQIRIDRDGKLSLYFTTITEALCYFRGWKDAMSSIKS